MTFVRLVHFSVECGAHYLQSEGVCSDANFLTGLRRDLQASHSFRVSGKNTILPAPFRTALCDKISMTANKMGMDR